MIIVDIECPREIDEEAGVLLLSEVLFLVMELEGPLTQHGEVFLLVFLKKEGFQFDFDWMTLCHVGKYF